MRWAMLVLILLPGGCALTSPTDAPAPTYPLSVQRAIDGDSFVASDGVEYRVGMINTPEGDACGGTEATAATYALLEDGFSAQPYASDRFDRSVTRITTPDGDLGVILAERGLADDRYLDGFAGENPTYAALLARAFEQAERDRVGLWRSCWSGETSHAQARAPSGIG